MSWPLAAAQIRSIVEGVAPSGAVRGRGLTFRHDPRGQRVALGETRTYWLEPRDALDEPAIASTLTHRVRRVDLCVWYRADPSALSSLREAIEADRDLLTTALGDPTLYGRPTSTLVDVRGTEGAYLPSFVEEVDDDGFLLILSLVVEHV